jgi:hypothetical protein
MDTVHPRRPPVRSLKRVGIASNIVPTKPDRETKASNRLATLTWQPHQQPLPLKKSNRHRGHTHEITVSNASKKKKHLAIVAIGNPVVPDKKEDL